jgi:hypothetical protein
MGEPAPATPAAAQHRRIEKIFLEIRDILQGVPTRTRSHVIASRAFGVGWIG